MNCPRCHYLLFNLTQPVCPECGSEFDVEQFRFAPGAVSFHCPHCDQPYYGNDANGLPSPRAFVCVRCQHPVTLQELRIVPAALNATGSAAIGAPTPWDQRRVIGLPRAWLKTLSMVLFRPGAFFRRHQGDSVVDAWIFAWLTSYATAVFVLVAALILEAVGLFRGVSGATGLGMMHGFGGSTGFHWSTNTGLWLLLSPAVIPVVVPAIAAVPIHLLMLCCVTQRRLSWSATLRVLTYALSARVVGIVPLVPLAAIIWPIAVAVSGLSIVHGVKTSRAALAVVVPVLLAILGTCGVVIFVSGSIIPMM